MEDVGAKYDKILKPYDGNLDGRIAHEVESPQL